MPAIFPIFETLLEHILRYGVQFLRRFSIDLCNVGKTSFFHFLFSIENIKVTWGHQVLFLVKNSQKNSEVLTDALSWCNFNELFCHDYGRFHRIASRK